MGPNSFPDKLEIRTPMRNPRKRGIHATTTMQDNIKVRVSAGEFALIQKLCVALNMDKAAFFRWCAVEVAKQMMEHCYDKQNTSDGC